jgi:hypothetical protein
VDVLTDGDIDGLQGAAGGEIDGLVGGWLNVACA